MSPDELPEVSAPPDYYRVVIDRVGKKWITSNQRQGWHAKARMTANWRAIAAWRAHRDVGDAQIDRARVVCELRFAANRRRDANNWEPTAKAVMDGLVDAGVFPDDNTTHVIGPDMRLGPPATGGATECLIVHIWRLPS